MKVVVFGGWAVLSEHMSTTAFLIVRQFSRSNAATTHCLFKIQKIKCAATRYHIALQAGKI